MLIERQGRDTASQRELFVLNVQASDQVPSDLELPSPRFVCLLAWDARTATVEEIAVVAQKLIGAGGVYIAAWGPDCGRVHDIIDEVVIGPDPPASELGPVMTTWHDNEDLADAISFVLQWAVPNEAFLTGCGSTLAITIGSKEWAEQMREAFLDSAAFVRNHA